MDSFSSQSVKKNYFPSDVLKFMKQNASPRQTIKLMQICKYFQHENFPFTQLKAVKIEDRMAFFSPKDEKFQCGYALSNIGRISNDLWLQGSFKALPFTKHLSQIISKIAYADIIKLDLLNQTINFEEFKFLTATGNIKSMDLKEATVTGKDGDKTAMEEIIKCVPNVEKITWHHKLPSFTSATNANEIKLQKLEKFELIYNPDNFNLTTFLPFMINHGQSKFALQTEKPRLSDTQAGRLLRLELLSASSSDEDGDF